MTQAEAKQAEKIIWDHVTAVVKDAGEYLSLSIINGNQLSYNINNFCDSPKKEIIEAVLQKNAPYYNLAIITNTNFDNSL